MEFQAFPKIPRFSRDCIITEKIDGTNGQIVVADGNCTVLNVGIGNPNGFHLHVGSRSRWLTEKEDNYGFYKWAMENREELLKLGRGRHFGEWWGAGIQRGYGLTEKRFSLFHTHGIASLPTSCVSVVPTIYEGEFTSLAVDSAISVLAANGSLAAPGFMRPEGIVIYHKAAGVLFKKTLEKDGERKGQVTAA
jgi:hypothetical protein